jgi:hypothetical protein
LRKAVLSYKVLVFSTNQLLRWETIAAPDDIAAVNAVPACEEAGKIEVWRGDRRLAQIKCVGGRPGAGF